LAWFVATARFAVGESHEPAARRSSGSSFSPAAGGDHQPPASAGAAGGGAGLGFRHDAFSSVCRVGQGQPPLPTRLVSSTRRGSVARRSCASGGTPERGYRIESEDLERVVVDTTLHEKAIGARPPHHPGHCRKIEGDRALEDRLIALARCSISRCGFAIKSCASADPRSTRCMRVK
jgi:hypothetical protein